MTPRSLVLIAALLPAAAHALPRSEVGAHAGTYLAGGAFASELRLDVFAALSAEGRWLPAPRGTFVDHLLVEGAVGGLVPVGTDALGEAVAIARVGLAFDTVRFSVGGQLRLSPTPVSPAQVFPSLDVTWQPGDVAVTFALFDRIAGPVARLAVAWRGFGIAYAPLAGLEAFGRIAVGPTTALEVRAFGLALIDTRMGGATVGLVWTPGGAR